MSPSTRTTHNGHRQIQNLILRDIYKRHVLAMYFSDNSTIWNRYASFARHGQAILGTEFGIGIALALSLGLGVRISSSKFYCLYEFNISLYHGSTSSASTFTWPVLASTFTWPVLAFIALLYYVVSSTTTSHGLYLRLFYCIFIHHYYQYPSLADDDAL